MKINANESGNILSWGIETIGEEYAGKIPSDFNQKRYFFTDGKIVKNEYYIEKQQEV